MRDALIRFAAKTQNPFAMSDVYREPDFFRIDFPSIVRSIACVPLAAECDALGLLVAGHSRPGYFEDKHLRVLKILAGFAAQIASDPRLPCADAAGSDGERAGGRVVGRPARFPGQRSGRRWVPPDFSS